MVCHFCGEDPRVVCLYPTSEGSVYGCIPCGIKRDLYCLRHEKPHGGHAWGGSVCMDCARESFDFHRHRAEEIYRQIMDALPSSQREFILDWAEPMDDSAEAVLRALILEANRRRGVLGDVIEETIATRSAKNIVPYAD